MTPRQQNIQNEIKATKALIKNINKHTYSSTHYAALAVYKERLVMLRRSLKKT